MGKYKSLQEIKNQDGHCRGMLCDDCCLGDFCGNSNYMSARYSDRLIYVNKLLLEYRGKKLERILGKCIKKRY